MNIEEFLELNNGKWFAHRTSNDLTTKKSVEAKSEIVIEKIAATDPEVVQLCEQYQVESSPNFIASLINWNDKTALNKKNTGSTVLILVPDSNNSNEGKLLSQVTTVGKPSLGRYKLGSDDNLLLIVESDGVFSEERIWFASNNLRMRVNVVKQADGFSTTSFTTEIRMGVPPVKADATANSASS
jgi:CpeS-like protein